ncbi:MAG: UvrB/UvrC motif-containing protein [Limnochordales bacterium]|jgi:Uncharacterized protein with conserved CXXC pairs|nr:hypothetical protein [Bacillota bacterium]
MLCEQCKQAPATVHITQVVNDVRREMHLCEQCAAQVTGDLGLSWPTFSFNKLLGGLLAPDSVTGLAGAPATGGRCPNCGLSFADYRRMGLLGCSQCYETFDRQLEPVLRRLHGNTVHTGKVPLRQAGRLRIERELERLRQELQEAIGKEEYERAAVLRDRIRMLEKQQQSARSGG